MENVLEKINTEIAEIESFLDAGDREMFADIRQENRLQNKLITLRWVVTLIEEELNNCA